MSDIVAVDIGGTHVRFALATINPGCPILLTGVETQPTGEHVSFEKAWEKYRERLGGTVPRDVSIALAGPVDDGAVIRFTNNPWTIHPALLCEKLGVERFTIVNDFEAVAHAVARSHNDQFIHLTGPNRPIGVKGTISVLGPGTGLGVAHLLRKDGGGYHVTATEGGHIDFAPRDEVEDAILARLRKRFNRVSVERVVSGPAIVDLYQVLAAIEGRSVPELSDVELWTRGISGEDDLAAAAVDRFCLSLGSVAGDVALVQGGFAGVVIAGGLGLRIRDALVRSGFAERFRAKGRFAELMATIPVKLIVHPQPGLLGAAAVFAMKHL